MSKNKLEQYKEKRNFNQTKEPKEKANSKYDKSIFVIQKHDAQKLHYDFRIESNGVLKSWALPKGPSTDPSVKRLAIETEDHPMDYADFEGHIPQGNYGAGQVIIWDKGTYENHSKKEEKVLSIKDAYDKGHISIWLKGEKLKGGYELVHMHDDQWLLIKTDDSEVDARRKPTKTQTKSVISDQSIEDIKEDQED
jgi:DNA ligase D-like protein (predicted 3'-phosphoesterase)